MGPHVWWLRWCREREWGLTSGGRDGVERGSGASHVVAEMVERGSGASRVVAEMV